MTWRFNGWPTAEEWQAVWAFATVLVAIIAAAIALRQYRISVRSRVEQARPFVIVDFAFIHTSTITIEVKNTGLTAAIGIGFSWSARPVADDERSQAAIDRGLVVDGIPFLAPGRSIRYYLRPFEEDISPRQYQVTATYRGSGDEKRWSSSSVLDLDQWADAIADQDPFERLRKELTAISGSLRKAEPINKSVGRAADALLLYLDGQPEVQTGRVKINAMLEERARLQREDIRLHNLEGGRPSEEAPLSDGSAPQSS